MEYKHKNYFADNQVISGYNLFINDKITQTCSTKEYIGSLLKKADFYSKNWMASPVQIKEGCTNLGTAYIPLSETQSLYVVLRESQKDIRKAK